MLKLMDSISHREKAAGEVLFNSLATLRKIQRHRNKPTQKQGWLKFTFVWSSESKKAMLILNCRNKNPIHSTIHTSARKAVTTWGSTIWNCCFSRPKWPNIGNFIWFNLIKKIAWPITTRCEYLMEHKNHSHPLDFIILWPEGQYLQHSLPLLKE